MTTSRLSFRQLRAANTARVVLWHPPYKPQWNSSDWMTATMGELGEAANFIKKLNRWRDGVQTEDDPPPDELLAAAAIELADTVIYLDLLAEHLEIDLAAEIVKKFNAVSRKNDFYVFIDPTSGRRIHTDPDE